MIMENMMMICLTDILFSFGFCFSVIGHVSDENDGVSHNSLVLTSSSSSSLQSSSSSAVGGVPLSPPVVNSNSNGALELLLSSRKGIPYIDKDNSPNVTALLGKTAYLTCRVKNLADKTVSFVNHLYFNFAYNRI